MVSVLSLMIVGCEAKARARTTAGTRVEHGTEGVVETFSYICYLQSQHHQLPLQLMYNPYDRTLVVPYLPSPPTQQWMLILEKIADINTFNGSLMCL